VPTSFSKNPFSIIPLSAARVKTMSLTEGSRGMERPVILPLGSKANATLAFSSSPPNRPSARIRRSGNGTAVHRPGRSSSSSPRYPGERKPCHIRILVVPNVIHQRMGWPGAGLAVLVFFLLGLFRLGFGCCARIPGPFVPVHLFQAEQAINDGIGDDGRRLIRVEVRQDDQPRIFPRQERDVEMKPSIPPLCQTRLWPL